MIIVAVTEERLAKNSVRATLVRELALPEWHRKTGQVASNDVQLHGHLTMAVIYKGWLPAISLGLLLVFFGVGCAPSPKEVVGTYKGTLYGAQEILVLRVNGTMTQKLLLPDGRTFTTDGTWHLKNAAVILSHYVFFYDAVKGALIEPQVVSSNVYTWGSGILYSECAGGDYVLERVSP